MFPQAGRQRNRNQILTLTPRWHETRSFLGKTTGCPAFRAETEQNRLE